MSMSKRYAISPETLELPEKLQGRMFFTYAEFGSLIGVSDQIVRRWVYDKYLKCAEFSPRHRYIPIAELHRFLEGKLMEKRTV